MASKKAKQKPQQAKRGGSSSPPARRSTKPPPAGKLVWQRDTFVQTFFKKGAEFTEELLRENERLRKQAINLETDNAALRTQLASDEAIRDLLKKIHQLEREKEQLLSHVNEAEATSTRFSVRFSEMEEELAKLANLYVASYQLHSTLRPPSVVKHLKELLQQLVGARSYAVYMVKDKELVLIASEGVDRVKLARVPINDNNESVAPPIERAYLTGMPQIMDGDLRNAGPLSPAAVVPLRFDDRVVGVIAVFSVFEQKSHFVTVDFELFNMMGAHAASALAGALLFDGAGGRLPNPEALHSMEKPS